MNKTFKRTALASAILSITLGLTACGSSSSSGDGSSFTATSSGTAAKGIINGGIVTAVELNSDKSEIGEVGSATTNADGTYELTLSSDYSGGPILLTLTTDADSQMKCDTVGGCIADDPATTDIDESVGFGTWYQPGVGAITLKALIPSAANGASISASITPFTNMAAARAMATDTLDAEAVSSANSEVSALLGINPLTTAPIDITDPNAAGTANEIVYAALTSAIANIAGSGGDVQAVIDNLATSFEDGILAADDSNDVDGGDTNISLQEIVDGANETFTETGTEDTSGVTTNMQEEVDTAEAGDGTIDPEPTDTATASAVDKAKALVSDFRTYANDLQATFEDPNFASSFSGELQTAGDILENMEGSDNPITALAAAIEIYDNIEDIFSFNKDGTADDTIEFTDSDPSPFDSGSVRLVATTNLQSTPGNTAEDGTYSESESGTYSGTLTFTDAVVGSQTANITITISNGEFSYSYDETTNEVSDTDNPFPNDSVEQDSSAEDTTISGTIEGNGATLTLNADASMSYDFRGQYVDTDAESTYTQEESEEFSFSASSVSLSVPTGDTTSVTYSGPFSVAGFSNYHYEDYCNKADGFGCNVYSYDDETYITSVSLDGTITAGDESVSLEITGGMPNAAEFVASGEVESENNYLHANIGVALNVDLTDLQDVSVNLSANRTGLKSGTAMLSLSHGDRSIVLQGDATLAEGADEAANAGDYTAIFSELSGDITVTDINGTVMTIYPPEEGSNVLATVEVDGLVVAEITETENGLIKASYSDGTFELF